MTLLLSILLSLSAAFASDCSTINLITAPDSPFNKIPVYDQDGSGLCYAFVAAQLIDYNRIKKGATERSVHPAWAALSYAYYNNDNEITGGFPDLSSDAMLRYNNCPYVVVHEALKELSLKANVGEGELLDFFDKYAAARSSQKSDQESPTYTAIKDAAKSCRKTDNALMNLLPNLQDLGTLSSPELINTLLMPACKGKYQKFNYDVSSKERGTDEDFLEEIMSVLDRKLPLGFNHCSNSYADKNYDGIKQQTGIFKKYNRKNIEKACKFHTAIIAGRKMSGGTCKLLVRNSWGTIRTLDYGNELCLCRHKVTGIFKDDCTQADAQDYLVEACWFDAKALAKNTASISVIK